MKNKTTASAVIAHRLTGGALKSLVDEMVEGGHADNSYILGHIMQGNRCVQVQVIVTQDKTQFMEWLG